MGSFTESPTKLYISWLHKMHVSSWCSIRSQITNFYIKIIYVQKSRKVSMIIIYFVHHFLPQSITEITFLNKTLTHPSLLRKSPVNRESTETSWSIFVVPCCACFTEGKGKCYVWYSSYISCFPPITPAHLLCRWHHSPFVCQSQKTYCMVNRIIPTTAIACYRLGRFMYYISVC